MGDHGLERFSVLVVDGDSFMAGLTTSALSAFDLGGVADVRSGEAAKEYLRNEKAHCVILDLPIDAENRLDLVDYIRRNPASPNQQMPIILCTAETDLANICEARDHGVSEVLAKPFSTAELLAKLTSALFRMRGFVTEDIYTGPDRRRRDAGWEGPERRGSYGLAQDQIDEVMREGDGDQ